MSAFTKETLSIGRLKRKSEIVETDLGDELVLLDPDTQVLYLLDEVGTYVWRHLPELGLSHTLHLLEKDLTLSKADALKGIDTYVFDLLMSGFFYQVKSTLMPDYLRKTYDPSKN